MRYEKPMPLSGKQRRALRAQGHHLQPIVQVGQQGVTPAVIQAVDQALADHELVKVRLGDDRAQRAKDAAALASETKSEVAQELGHTALLFRRRVEDSAFGWLDSKHVAPPGADRGPPSGGSGPVASRQR